MYVLYVEDEVRDQTDFVAEGAKRGFGSIDVESQGANTIPRVRAKMPDVLVLDWGITVNQLSDDYMTMDGVCIAKEVRRLWPDVPILILTQYDPEDERHGEEQKIAKCRYLKKTAEWDSIFTTIDELASA